MRKIGVAALAAVAAAGVAGTAGPAAARSSNELATADCVTQWTGTVISGAEPGATDSGPNVIFAFEYAYYVQRSGAAARAVVSPDATNIGSIEMIQNGIDAQPVGSRYCVLIVPDGSSGGDDAWDVHVTQQYPDGQRTRYEEEVTTRATATGSLISGIYAR